MTRALILLILVSLYVAGEDSESGYVRFLYDPESKSLVVITTNHCYLVALNHEERDHVYARGGMETIELKFMRDWLGKLNETYLFRDDNLSANVHSWCYDSGQAIFRLERTIHEQQQGIVG